MNDSDRKTFKLKNYHKKKKDKDSNSSRESLEMEIKSFENNKKISQKKTGEGEEIKFFFNEPPITKKKIVSKFKLSPISSNKTNPHPTFNLLNEKNESNFKDILLHYVKSPENQTKKKIDEKVDKRSSIIHGDPQTVLTLNGDESSNNSEIKKKIIKIKNYLSQNLTQVLFQNPSLNLIRIQKKNHMMKKIRIRIHGK